MSLDQFHRISATFSTASKNYKKIFFYYVEHICNKLTFLWIVLMQVWSLRLIFYETCDNIRAGSILQSNKEKCSVERRVTLCFLQRLHCINWLVDSVKWVSGKMYTKTVSCAYSFTIPQGLWKICLNIWRKSNRYFFDVLQVKGCWISKTLK